MSRPDAASCAALAADLHAGAARLRAAADHRPADTTPHLGTLTTALDRLGHALDDYAAAARDPHPTPPGRPHPATALRRECDAVVAALRP